MPADICFVISLHRTGTKSTIELLRSFGMRSHHFVESFNGIEFQSAVAGHETDHKHISCLLRPLLATLDAVADVPFPVLYRQLAEDYPEARFILLHRDPVDWANSVKYHIGKREFDVFERVQYWHYFPWRPATIRNISVYRLARMHVRHSAEVSNFFKGSDRFITASLESPSTPGAIANFLGHKARTATMPYLGKGGSRKPSSKRAFRETVIRLLLGVRKKGRTHDSRRLGR